MLNLDPLAVVNTPALRPEENTGTTATPDYSGLSAQALQNRRLAGGSFSIDPALAEKIKNSRETMASDLGAVEFGIGEDLFVDEKQNQGYITTASGAPVRNNNIGRLTEAQDANTATLLGQQGLQYDYKQDEYKGYRYNPNTGQYDYYDNTPSYFDQYAGALVKAGIMGVATAGLGGALASSSALSGFSPAMAGAIGKAAASTGLSAFMGDDVDLESTVKNLASAYGMEQLTGLSDVIDTGSEFADNILKDTVGSIATGKDPKEAVLSSLLEQAGNYASDFLDLGDTEDSILAGLSDFDKEYLQPIKNYVEDALGVDFSEAFDEIKDDVDGFLAQVPDSVKDVVEGFVKIKLGEATGSSGSTGSTAQYASLGNTLLQPSPDKGPVDYKDLTGNLLKNLVI